MQHILKCIPALDGVKTAKICKWDDFQTYKISTPLQKIIKLMYSYNFVGFSSILKVFKITFPTENYFNVTCAEPILVVNNDDDEWFYFIWFHDH